MKAQSKLDFLITYLWVIIIVVVFTFFLMYFGVIGKERFKDKCEFSGDFSCTDIPVLVYGDNGEITLALRTNRAISLQKSYSSDACGEGSIKNVNGDSVFPANISAGRALVITVPCSITKQKFKTDISFDYVDVDTGSLYTVTGSIQGLALEKQSETEE